jgi:hypothetical protein
MRAHTVPSEVAIWTAPRAGAAGRETAGAAGRWAEDGVSDAAVAQPTRSTAASFIVPERIVAPRVFSSGLRSAPRRSSACYRGRK